MNYDDLSDDFLNFLSEEEIEEIIENYDYFGDFINDIEDIL